MTVAQHVKLEREGRYGVSLVAGRVTCRMARHTEPPQSSEAREVLKWINVLDIELIVLGIQPSTLEAVGQWRSILELS